NLAIDGHTLQLNVPAPALGVPPPPSPAVFPIPGLTDDLSPPSLRALPEAVVEHSPPEDEDLSTPVTHTAPSLDAIGTSDLQPATPITQTSVDAVATVDEFPIRVLLGEPIKPIEPIEPIEAVEPIEPIEPVEPIEPSRETIESNNSSDLSDTRDS